MVISKTSLQIVAFCSLILIVVPRGLSTNEATYQIFKFFNYLGIFALPAFVALAFSEQKVRSSELLLFLYMMIFIAIAFANRWNVDGHSDSYIMLTLAALCLGLILTTTGIQFIQKSFYACLVIFCIIFIVNIVAGNLFNLNIGSEFNNYQGISKVSAVLFISFFYLAHSQNRPVAVFLFYGLCAAFFVVCMMGGGRGELILSLVAIMPLVFAKGRSIVAIPIVAIIVLNNAESIFELKGVQRILFAIEAKSTGSRLELALEALQVFTQDVKTVLFGCGFNCFQGVKGYEFGLYPHNYAIEVLVTFGILGSLPIAITIFRCLKVWVFSVSSKNYGFILIAVYFMLVSMKSGSLVSSFASTLLIVLAASLASSERASNSVSR